MKRFIFSVIYFIPLMIWGQQQNIWYFGNRAGIDFTTGIPITDSQMLAVEGCASIADSDGSLLFYTNGITVWNKNHQIMDNGEGLSGHQSSTQSALIVPKPGDATHYYIFTAASIGEQEGLKYSEVDMSMNQGTGAIINKNSPLVTPVCEKIAGTYHSNGFDIWVMTHRYGTDEFYAYLITAEGVSETPVISNSVVVIGTPIASTIGCMKISPQGTKLAIANDYHDSQLHDFNAATGAVTNAYTFAGSGYGVEFSPSGDLLYFNSYSRLYQFDMTSPDIAASGLQLNEPFPPDQIGTLQAGPDGKIYVAVVDVPSLSVINNPDIVGTGCNYTPLSFDLLGRNSQLGLPNSLPIVYLPNFSSDPGCLDTPISFTIASIPAGVTNFLWEFGDGTTSTEESPTHSYDQAGLFTVRLTVTLDGVQRATQKTIQVYPLPTAEIPDPFRVCGGQDNESQIFSLNDLDGQVLGGQDAADFSVSYHISHSDASAGIDPLPESYANISNPQIIYSRVVNADSGCYAVGTCELVVLPGPEIDFPEFLSFCKGETLLLEAPQGFDAYLWSTGENSQAITVSQPGIYTLKVSEDFNGVECEATVEVDVQEEQYPVIGHIEVNDWNNQNNSIRIFATRQGYEYSVDGLHFQAENFFENLPQGIYTVTARNSCGTTTQEVVILMYPRFFTPNADGVNDTWRIPYSYYEPAITIDIYDRYGKQLASFDGNNPGWDGKFNAQNLPATDYWFLVRRSDGRIHRGHFSMIR